MADTENIGGIDISITGDYSPLADAFATAEGMASTAGKNIADALAEGAASGADAAQQITAQLSTLAPAADDAAASMAGAASAADGLSSSEDEAAGNTQRLGSAAGETGGKLAEMAEKLATIGEALVVTEGLKELGSEALGAADNVTRASIALTTLTGDSEIATSTIESLEQLGMSDGLSFPSLLTAATRMTAMLPPGTDVVALLGHIADGAAITGSSVEQAANRFDMITNAGTLSARALTSMGLSLPAVAAAMNVVTGAADATDQSVSAMFKAMDPGQRIQVLQQALSALGGTAEQVANQTFGGQWQQLVNQWDALMVQAGQAILPLVSSITEFLKLDVVPFVQGLVDAWKELPGPLQDVTIGVAAVTAAVAPLVGGLAALGLAMTALEGVVPAVTGLLGTFGTTAAETAAEEGLATAATEELGAASEVAAGEMGIAGAAAGSLAGILAGVLVVGIVAAGVSLIDLKNRLNDAHSALVGISDQDLKEYLAGITTVAKGTGDAGTATEQFAAKLATLKGALDLGVISGQQYAAAVKAIDEAQKQADITGFASQLKGLGDNIHLVGATAQATVTQQQLLSQAVAEAKAKVDELTASYQGTEGQAQALLAAQKSLQGATDALNASLGPVPGTMEAIDAAAAKLAGTQDSLAAKTATAAAMEDAQNAQLAVAQNAYEVAAAKLQLLDGQVQEWTAAQDGSAKAAQGLLQAQQALSTQIAVASKAQSEYQAVLGEVSAAEDEQSKVAMPALLDAYRVLATAMGPTMAALTGLTSDIANVSAALPNFGIQMSQGASQVVVLENALQEARGKLAGYQAQMADGADVGKQYLKAQQDVLSAQIALDQEVAVATTGMQGATDAVSLYTQQVAAAKVKLDDLTAAYQDGLVTGDKVLAAQKALTSAQDSLNQAIAEAPDPITHLTAAEAKLADQSASTAQQTDVATVAFQKQGAAVDALGADIQSLTGDWLGLGDAMSKASGGGSSFSGGGAGWTSTLTGFGLQGQKTFAASYTPNVSQAELQSAIDMGALSLADAEAVEASMNLLGYNDNYNLHAKGTGTSGASSSPVSSSGTVASAGGPSSSFVSASAAVNGGVYPDVTAHQASGEIWTVAFAGSISSGATAVGGGGVSSDATAALAASSTASAVASAAGTMAVVVGQMQDLTSGIGAVATQLNLAITQSKAAPGTVVNLTPGQTGTSAAITGGGGTAYTAPINSQQTPQGLAGAPTSDQYASAQAAAQAAAAAAGVPWDGSVPWDGVRTANSSPASSSTAGVTLGQAGGLTVQAHFDFSGANFSGTTNSQLQSTMTQAVTDGLVSALRAGGARF